MQSDAVRSLVASPMRKAISPNHQPPAKPESDGVSRRPSAVGEEGPTSGPRSAACARSTAASPNDPAARAALESTLKLASRGNQQAWRILIDAYSGRVFGLIRAQCGSADLAEEITQSAFCTVAEKIGSYTELGRFEQWLFRIAMNRLRDEMRRRKRQARPVENEALRAMADADTSPRGRSEQRPAHEIPDAEQLHALRLALAELPEADQQIINLRHNGGLSFKEIADVLEQPLGTVLARQHRALKKLAEVLTKAMEGRQSSIGRVRRASEEETTTDEDLQGGLAGDLGGSPQASGP